MDAFTKSIGIAGAAVFLSVWYFTGNWRIALAVGAIHFLAHKITMPSV